MIKKIYIFIATGLGLGLISYAPGTFGTLLGIPFFFFLSEYPYILLLITVVLFFIGVYVSNKASIHYDKKDPSCVVIDEAVGFLIACLFIKFTAFNLLLAFILFRLFDITKPYPIKKLEKYNDGWGIMLDDVLAGVYANICIRIFHGLF